MAGEEDIALVCGAASMGPSSFEDGNMYIIRPQQSAHW